MTGPCGPEESEGAASEYLRLFALVAVARFFMTRILPETSSLFAKIMAGKEGMMAMAEEAF